jgi:hypoxanthine phosphoribosyltransferase
MINSSTVLLPLLTIDSKNTLYYNLSILVFSIVGCANHILPENLDGLTHVVKMLFSNVLFSMFGMNFFAGFFISLVDLSPLFTKNTKMKKYGESFLQIPRLLIEVYFMLNQFEKYQWEVLTMIVCKIIYFFERRARIKKGIRNDFSSWHSAEHCGLYLFFWCYSEVEFSFLSLVIIFVLFVVATGLFLHFVSSYLHLKKMERVPQWVKSNTEIMAVLEEKLVKNRYSKKWRNYYIKPWASHLKLEFVTWNAIETICLELSKKVKSEDFDLVVGITTGGSFVGYYLSILLKLPYISVRSKFWSEITFTQNFIQTYKLCLGIEQMPKTGEIPAEVKNKKILLVDDTTYSGITLNGIKKRLFENGASEVFTMVMWSKGSNNPDYYYCNKRIPIIWEWGAEVD